MMFTKIDEPGNIVVDMIMRKPDIFTFLLDVLRSQTRFNPIPTWFKAGDVIDKVKFDRAIKLINVGWRDRDVKNDSDLIAIVDRDAYMLARFMILSCPLQLESVEKSVDTCKWKQFRAVWPENDEHQWSRIGGDKTPDYLYHGSPIGNWANIIRTGLKVVSNTPWMTSGAAYGVGVYCSPDLSISWGYSHAGTTTPIIVGVYEIWDAEQWAKTPGIYVIPDASKLRLRYLIYMPDSSKVDVQALNLALRAHWNTISKAKLSIYRKYLQKRAARISRETDVLKTAGAAVDIHQDLIQVGIAGRQFVVTLPYEFPFSAPVIHSGETQIRHDWNPRMTISQILNDALETIAK